MKFEIVFLTLINNSRELKRKKKNNKRVNSVCRHCYFAWGKNFNLKTWHDRTVRIHIRNEFYLKTSWVLWMEKRPVGQLQLHVIATCLHWASVSGWRGFGICISNGTHKNIYEASFSRCLCWTRVELFQRKPSVFPHISLTGEKRSAWNVSIHNLLAFTFYMFTLTIEMERVALATHVLDLHSRENFLWRRPKPNYICISHWTHSNMYKHIFIYCTLLKHPSGEMSASSGRNSWCRTWINICAHTDGDISSSLPFHIYDKREQKCTDIIRVAVSHSAVQAPHWNHWSTATLFTHIMVLKVCQYAIKIHFFKMENWGGIEMHLSFAQTRRKNNAFNTHKRWVKHPRYM